MASNPVSASTSRLSCTLCRVKKLKCDREKPRCSRCVTVQEECVYPTSRRNHIGKRSQVQELESRLAQVEGLLQNTKANEQAQANVRDGPSQGHVRQSEIRAANSQNSYALEASPGTAQANWMSRIDAAELSRTSRSQEMPPIDLVEELTQIYFNRLHHASPMLHQSRYMKSLRSSADIRSPLCLRYIVMAVAALSSATHDELATPFYQMARNLAESKEMLGEGMESTSLALAQCWCLISCFEAEKANFARASISFSRSLRMAQILDLHLTGANEATKSSNATSSMDCIELEERRRTWWVIFMCDRFIFATTGWPTQIDVRDIKTVLPASEEAFSLGLDEHASTLADILCEKQHGYSSFAGRVLTSHLFFRTLQHTLQSLEEGQEENDLTNGQYWVRQRSLDNDLVIMMMLLPEYLKFPRNFQCQSAIFINSMIHTATICLHRAALYKSRELRLSESMTVQHKMRLLPAAQAIVYIMRVNPDMEASLQNPLMAFSVYTASLVFLDDIIAEASRESEANLELLLHIMLKMSKANAVVRSLAVQLAAEMQQGGVSSSVVRKIQTLPVTPQPFLILSKKNAGSLNGLFRYPRTSTMSPSNSLAMGEYLSHTDLRADLIGAEDFTLQLQASWPRQEGCCDETGGWMYGLQFPPGP